MKILFIVLFTLQINIGYNFVGEIKEIENRRGFVEVKVQDNDNIRVLQLYSSENQNFIRNKNIGDEIIIDIKDGELLKYYRYYPDRKFIIKLKSK